MLELGQINAGLEFLFVLGQDVLIQLHVDLGDALAQYEGLLQATVRFVKDLELFCHQVKSVVALVEQIGLEKSQLLTRLIEPSLALTTAGNDGLGELTIACRFTAVFAVVCRRFFTLFIVVRTVADDILDPSRLELGL